MKRRVLGVLMAATAYYCALAVLVHFPPLGPQLAAYAHAQPPVVSMGKTTLIKPGTIVTDDGSHYTILGGVQTANPKGFVLDWSNPHGVYECETSRKEADGSCTDGARVHYVNPTTGDRQDAMVKSSSNEPIPVAVPSRGD